MENQWEKNDTTLQEKYTQFCKYCGEKMDVKWALCPKCGRLVEDFGQEPLQEHMNDHEKTNVDSNVKCGRFDENYPYKSRIIAFLLVFFLGFLGVHRFYVGKIGTGVLWMLTCGFFGIGWGIDTVLIFLGLFTDKQKMFLR